MPYADPERRKRYAREWAAKRRATFFEGRTCQECGGADRLELDHVDPTLKVSHSIWSWSQVRREAEIAKCQVLCFPCHRRKSCIERGYHEPGSHGRQGYENGCRCTECRAGNAAHARTVRANRKARQPRDV
ncbi:hypothetical protein DT87_00150 [Streptomyces sp. NTK 937]|nr:hypothetical protein DT87_00150 [Streptomyces sp. NTK 937]